MIHLLCNGDYNLDLFEWASLEPDRGVATTTFLDPFGWAALADTGAKSQQQTPQDLVAGFKTIFWNFCLER